MTAFERRERGSQTGLGLFIGSFALSLVFGCLIPLISYIHVRSESLDVPFWIYFYFPLATVVTGYQLSFASWVSCKQLLWAAPPSIVIASLMMSRGLFLDPFMVLVVAVVMTIFMGLGLLGMGLAASLRPRMKTNHGRIVAQLGAVALLIAIPLVRWAFWGIYAQHATAQALVLGEASLKVQASDLKRTAVVPTLETPIIAGTNLVWCGTFQLVWNELGELVNEEIHMSPEHPMVAKLNKKELTHADLDETTYFVAAGIPGSRLYSRRGSATPPPASLPALSKLSQPIASAYAYLAVDLPFEWAFERLKQPLDFKGTKVRSFGIYQYLESQEKERRAATQLRIYDRAHEHDVIIELVTRQTGHRLILAMVPIETTLADTIQSVQARIETSEPEGIGDCENLTIPLLDFDLTREYVELINRPLNVSSRVLDGRPIGQATQNIRFKLDERGAYLRSAGLIAVLGMAPQLIFDKPFLIFLQYEGSDKPYFAAWIDNPELLVEF